MKPHGNAHENRNAILKKNLWILGFALIPQIAKSQQISFKNIQLIDNQSLKKEWMSLEVKHKRVKAHHGTYSWYKPTDKPMRVSNYLPLYWGKLDTSISINYKAIPYAFFKTNSVIEEEGSFKHEGFSTESVLKLDIYVDTTRLIGNCDELFSWDSTYYYAYPVFIYNKSRQKYIVGYFEQISLQLEAQNEAGQWVQIESAYWYECGFNALFPYIKPKHLMITSCVVPQGDFYTRLRLRLGKKTYSNEFSGWILKEQLQLMP